MAERNCPFHFHEVDRLAFHSESTIHDKPLTVIKSGRPPLLTYGARQTTSQRARTAQELILLHTGDLLFKPLNRYLQPHSYYTNTELSLPDYAFLLVFGFYLRLFATFTIVFINVTNELLIKL